VQNNGFYTNKTLNIRGTLVLLDTPVVMGILNVTPDSFYDGGKFIDERTVLEHTEKMVREGARFIDVGGYSTRPGAPSVDVEEEERRVLPVIRLLASHFPTVPVSVDTFRSAVAQKAVEAGASMINDISGGEGDEAMFDTVASLGIPYILMHMRGTPQTMSKLTNYDDIVKEIADYFHRKIHALHQRGVKDIILDPGFGFSKTPDQNFELLHQLDYFTTFGIPILAGFSRKSMVWKTLDTNPAGALNGTTALNTIALSKGAKILRVHDVKEAVECITLFEKMKKQPVV